MSTTFWSAVLQWSRLGVNAGLFLVAARYLSLAEIGAFATAFAPVRLVQGTLRAGLGDIAILRAEPQDALIALSAAVGLIAGLALAVTGLMLPPSVGTMMAVLSPIPLIQGLAQPSEAHLRRTLRLRALALRTLAAQTAAAAVALLALAQGAGPWSLAVFALANTALTAALSLWLAPIRLGTCPKRGEIRALLPDALRLSLRDLAGNATLPLLQLAVGACLGLPAAGAFQIASRVLGLIDALAIAPLRYVALPRFTGLQPRALRGALARNLRQSAGIACIVYPAVAVAAPDLLVVAVGSEHAEAAAPLMPAFCLAGLLAALAMPLNQALSASGHIRLTLNRNLATLVLTLTLALPGLSHSLTATVWALPGASSLVLIWYLKTAHRLLRPDPRELAAE
ncbi:oligosaccharide flippase family protein [Ruegeria sediminis]|nr:oligosaccharide flippase family protein [Ruegeria sediminis]